MTTLIVDVKNSSDAQKIADALRRMDSVVNVTIKDDDFERIPSLPYTMEEHITAVQEAEVGYESDILLKEGEDHIIALKTAIQEGLDSGVATDFDPVKHLQSLKVKRKNG